MVYTSVRQPIIYLNLCGNALDCKLGLRTGQPRFHTSNRTQAPVVFVQGYIWRN